MSPTSGGYRFAHHLGSLGIRTRHRQEQER